MAVCCVMAENLFPQRYFTKSYTIENGLQTRIISDVCQDNDGLMWFATYSGISSYDGFGFINYDVTTGLPQQHYRKVKIDEKGILWGIPERVSDTVVFLQNNIWNRFPPAVTTLEVETTAFDLFYRNSKPVICVGSVLGIDICQNAHWNHLDISKDPARNRILSLTSKSGKFYALTKAGVWVIEEGKSGWGFTEYLKLPEESTIAIKFELPGTPDEKLWMLRPDRITFLQHGKISSFAEGFILPGIVGGPQGGFLNFDTRGNVFFGNNWAKYYVHRNRGRLSPLMIKNGFSSNGASSIFIDKEQNIWFSDSRGIDKISNLLVENYHEINGLLENEVTAIVELADGRIVFGHNNGLSIYDHYNIKRIAFGGPENNLNRVQDIIQDRRGEVWVAASSKGFGRLLPGGNFRWYLVEPNSMATTVHQDVHGRIWLGTNRGLYYLKNDKLTRYEQNDKLSTSFRKIFSGVNGEIIGTGSYGMNVISGDKVKIIPVDKAVKTQNFFTYYRARSGIEYVGTLNGLCVIENGQIHKFDKNGIRIDSPVYFIFQDTDGTFWLGSNNGVFKWDGNKKFEVYNLHNGLAGRETNRSAGILDSHGNVWIGTDMGLSCFLPGFSQLKSHVPSLKLLDIEDRTGKHHSFTDDCTIGFNDNSLFFHFRGISYVNEDLITYRFKLEGLDRDWQLVNQDNLDKVKYTAIQPGRYRFVVQVKNDTGDWSEVVRSGIITISPPFFHSWWFNLILLSVVCSIIFGFIKIIIQRKYNLKLEKEISERKRSEQKTVQTLQALHSSELKYRELIEFAVDGILIGSKDGIITGANTTMQQLTGRSLEDLIGIHVDKLFNKGHLVDLPLRYDLLELGEMVVSHREIVSPDGTSIPIEMHTKMMPDGTYQSIYHDITQRKKLEDALRSSEEKFVKAFQNSPDPFAITRLRDGKYFDVNESYLRHSGYTRDEMVGKTLNDVNIWANPGDRMRYTTILKEHGRVVNLETIYKTKSNEKRYCLVSAELIEINGDQCILAIIHDITDRKITEEALKQKANELERFNSLMVGRELKMIELKKEINELLLESNREEKYIIHE